MSEAAERPVVDDRLPRGGKAARPCEFARAYSELVASRETGAPPPVRSCSELGPEERPYPPSPTGRPYSLCNGHLRDLFEALERASKPVA